MTTAITDLKNHPLIQPLLLTGGSAALKSVIETFNKKEARMLAAGAALSVGAIIAYRMYKKGTLQSIFKSEAEPVVRKAKKTVKKAKGAVHHAKSTVKKAKTAAKSAVRKATTAGKKAANA